MRSVPTLHRAMIEALEERRLMTGVFASATEIDIAYDSTGKLHVAYYDSSSQDLKYATRAINGVWSSVTTIDSTNDVGRFPSIAIDGGDKAHIAYFNATTNDAKYARNTSGTTWSITTIDSANNTGYYTSLALDNSDRPRISYFDTTNDDLRLASYNGSTWTTSTIDSTDSVGKYCAITINRNTDRWVIAYENDTSGQLKLAEQTAGSPTLTVVDDVTTRATEIDVAMDSSDRPAISYRDNSNTDLMFAHRNGAGSTWNEKIVSTKDAKSTNLFFDPSDGEAEIIWYDVPDGDVAYSKGTTSTTTWSHDFDYMNDVDDSDIAATMLPDESFAFSLIPTSSPGNSMHVRDRFTGNLVSSSTLHGSTSFDPTIWSDLSNSLNASVVATDSTIRVQFEAWWEGDAVGKVSKVRVRLLPDGEPLSSAIYSRIQNLTEEKTWYYVTIDNIGPLDFDVRIESETENQVLNSPPHNTVYKQEFNVSHTTFY